MPEPNTNPDIARLLAVCEALGIEDEDLDELVHDAKGAEAAAINNAGLDDQLEYLLDGMSARDLEAEIRDLAAR